MSLPSIVSANAVNPPATPLDFALAYARKEYYVFPVEANGKRPLTKNGFSDATIDPKIIEAWWRRSPKANVGIACKKSQLLVIDIDRHPGKPDGTKSYKGLNGYEPVLAAPRAVTGGGGVHIIFRSPGIGVKSILAPGVDVKSDGYIVVPPSFHASGNDYRWEPGRSLLEVAPVLPPNWLMSHLLKESATNPGQSFDDALDVTSEAPSTYPNSGASQLIANCKFMQHVATDGASLSEPEWYSGIGVLAYTQEAPRIVHECSSAYPGYSETETDKKLQHWLKDGKGPSTCRSIQEKCGPDYCKDCPWNGKIKSPIVLGYSSRALVEKLSGPVVFPSVLPGVFHDFSLAVSKSIQCPLDYVACATLALMSIAIGTSVRLQIKPEWTTYGNLFIAIVGSPAAKKSPAIGAVFQHLKPLQAKLMSDYDTQKGEYDLALRMFQVEFKNWQKAPIGAPPVEPRKPRLKQLVTSDSTVEALCELLDANGSGIGMVCDELSLWLRSMNQYKGGGGGDRSHYLSMWSNASITVNRKGKEPVYVPSPFLTVFGGIQPDVLPEISKSDGLRDGLIERVLLACPEKCVDLPNYGVSISSEIKAAYLDGIQKLFDLRSFGQRQIVLSEAALQAFVAAEVVWHQKINGKDFAPEMEAFYSKAPSQLGRLVLILHELKRATGLTTLDSVSEETVKDGRQLMDYFLSHAHLAKGMLSQSKEESQVEKAVKWIEAKGLTLVGPRDIYTNKVAGCRKKTEAITLLEKIYDYGYGHWAEKKHHLIFVNQLIGGRRFVCGENNKESSSLARLTPSADGKIEVADD
jgi:hypothetical protein